MDCSIELDTPVCHAYFLTHHNIFTFTPVFGRFTQQAPVSAKADSTVYISAKKAKELKVKSGQIVGVIGRRRRATYATVQAKKMSSDEAEISSNMGNNLRVRDADKLKIVKLGTDDTDADASGDMALLASTPSTAESVTLSPIEDSYNELVATEGGDEISDEEIMARFVAPYLDLDDEEKTVLLKKGHLLRLKDDNNRSLDFMVTNIEVDGAVDDEEEAEEGKIWASRWGCLNFLQSLRTLAHLVLIFLLNYSETHKLFYPNCHLQMLTLLPRQLSMVLPMLLSVVPLPVLRSALVTIPSVDAARPFS